MPPPTHQNKWPWFCRAAPRGGGARGAGAMGGAMGGAGVVLVKGTAPVPHMARPVKLSRFPSSSLLPRKICQYFGQGLRAHPRLPPTSLILFETTCSPRELAQSPSVVYRPNPYGRMKGVFSGKYCSAYSTGSRLGTTPSPFHTVGRIFKAIRSRA